MIEDLTPFYKQPRFWKWLIAIALILTFLWVFQKDVGGFVYGWRSFFLVLYNYDFDLLNAALREQVFALAGIHGPVLAAMFKLPFNILVFIVVFITSAFVVAQFVLPAHTWHERVLAWNRFLLYLIGWHGPAVFVREGKLIAQRGEEENTNPGAALVDLRSAIVLEQSYPWWFDGERNMESEAINPRRSLPFYFRRNAFQSDDPYSVTRVCGPGINFTEWGERIRNVIDLRPQIRIESGVKAFTKDGIEVETRVFVGFSVSNPPEVIPVAYVGGQRPENLFGLVIKKKSHGRIVITGKYDLDPSDGWEIHQRVMGRTVSDGEPISNTPTAHSARKGPFAFDEKRVFAAAYARAHRSSSSETTQWHELPVLIAVELFRQHIEQYTYDYLYMIDEPDRLPWLEEVKPEFMRKMKQQGLLSFKFMRLRGPNTGLEGSLIGWNTTPLEERCFGQSILESSLESSAAYPLQNTESKPLRERGISILFAGCSELKPPPAIREKLVERWKAKWELEIRTIAARNERESMQLINHARSQAQRDAVSFLSGLLQQKEHAKEALALLLFQALQAAATDEKNHKDLPPREVFAMIQNLHRWLLVEWEESEAKRKKDNKLPPPSNDQVKNP